MNNELKNGVITISKKEEKTTPNGNILINVYAKPENGQQYETRYTVWQKKQSDGSISNAWQQLERIKPGERVGISFVEKPREYTTPQGITKTTTDRTIRDFQTAVAQEETIVKTENGEPDWDKIAEGKVRNNIVVAFITKGVNLTPEVITEINKWVEYVMKGKVNFDYQEDTETENIPF